MSSYYGDGAGNAPTWDSLDDGYDEDVLDTAEYQYANRDHILFAIDASESMHQPMADEENPGGLIRGKSPLHQALDAVVGIERRKVVTGPQDSVGLMFYNVDSTKTQKSAAGNYKPGTYVVQALRQIVVEDIKRLFQLLETANQQYDEQSDSDEPTVEPAILRETFPPIDSKDELNVADVFVTCNFLFRDGGTKIVGNKRVFLVTDNDDPPGGSNRAPARTIFGDLSTYGVHVETCFVNRPGHKFDPSVYWNDILDRGDLASETEDGLEQLTDMILELVVRQTPKRRQFTVPLKFGGRDGDIEIGVSGYALISEQKKGQPKNVRMRGQAVEEVAIKTAYTSAETGGDLAESEITSAFQFGRESAIQNVLERNWWETEEYQEEQERQLQGLLFQHSNSVNQAMPSSPKVVARTRVQFTDKEIASFRSMDIDPQIKILGFQSPKFLEYRDNMKHAFFIYPDEKGYTGSTRTFSALLQSCIKQDRHALALCRLRAGSTPEFCVLIPQEETFDRGSQDDPPGFHVVVLPFVDDIRDQPRAITDNIPAEEEQTKVMERIVRRLRFKSKRYKPDPWPNPALAYHQQQLQALAFDEDFDTELFDDKALPKYGGIHGAAGQLMEEWNRLIEADSRAIEVTTAATKRTAVQLDADDLEDVDGAYRNGSMNKLKVADLRNYAKFHGISLGSASKKADIIDVLEAHLSKKQK